LWNGHLARFNSWRAAYPPHSSSSLDSPMPKKPKARIKEGFKQYSPYSLLPTPYSLLPHR
ncbi:MAG: hypothetical protein F6K56_37540, partial [Moorea sp. SIO3G5]|nr:hypothetical protein [Moorena sp. SIO3G5]